MPGIFAVDRQSLVVAGLCQIEMACILLDIAHMTHSVSQPEWVCAVAVNGSSFCVELRGVVKPVFSAPALPAVSSSRLNLP